MSSYQDDSSEEKLINSGSYHEAAKLIKNIKDAQKRYRLMKKLMEVLLPKYNDALRYVYFDEEGIIEGLGLVDNNVCIFYNTLDCSGGRCVKKKMLLPNNFWYPYLPADFVKEKYEDIRLFLKCQDNIQRLTKKLTYEESAVLDTLPTENLIKLPKRYVQFVDKTVFSSVYFYNSKKELCRVRMFGKFFGKNVRVYNNIETIRASDIPRDAAEIIMRLTGGSIDKLTNLAKLFAAIAVNNLAVKVPFAVFADKTDLGLLSWLISKIFSQGHLILTIQSKSLVNKGDNLPLLFESKLEGVMANVLTNDTLPKNSEFLRKIIAGKTIRVSNPPFKTPLYVSNNLPFIYLTSNQKQYNTLLNEYEAIGIEVPHDLRTRTKLSEDSCDWIRTAFVLFGLRCLNGYPIRTGKVKSKKTGYVEDNVVGYFINEVCTFSQGMFCPTQEMYDAFLRYFSSKFPSSVPLSKIMFGKEFVRQTHSEKGRHHFKKDDNPMCYLGVCIDKEKLDSVCAKNMAGADSSKFEANLDDFIKLLELNMPRENIIELSYNCILWP